MFIDVYYTPYMIENNKFLSVEDLDKPKEYFQEDDINLAVKKMKKYIKLGYSVFLDNSV